MESKYKNQLKEHCFKVWVGCQLNFLQIQQRDVSYFPCFWMSDGTFLCMHFYLGDSMHSSVYELPQDVYHIAHFLENEVYFPLLSFLTKIFSRTYFWDFI